MWLTPMILEVLMFVSTKCSLIVDVSLRGTVESTFSHILNLLPNDFPPLPIPNIKHLILRHISINMFYSYLNSEVKLVEFLKSFGNIKKFDLFLTNVNPERESTIECIKIIGSIFNDCEIKFYDYRNYEIK